jgi:hypothetical protein
MIYLSNFRTAGKDERAISIAAITPKWYKGAVRKDLAPKLSTLTKFKKGEITMMEYAFEYTKIIYSHDLDKLAEELDGHVLLCYCSKNDMCHRLLLGLYLNRETGIEVEEIGGFGNIITAPITEVDHPVTFILQKDDPDIDFVKKGDDLVGHWRKLKEIGKQGIFNDIQ